MSKQKHKRVRILVEGVADLYVPPDVSEKDARISLIRLLDVRGEIDVTFGEMRLRVMLTPKAEG